MNKRRINVFVAILCLSVIQMGCVKTLDETTESRYDGETEEIIEIGYDGTTKEVTETEHNETREEIPEEITETEDNEITEEVIEDSETIENDMESWIGKYQFDECFDRDDAPPMFMTYEIEIYKENEQYYADIEVNGHMTGINLRAKLYGNEKWISLVIEEYYPEHIIGCSNMENNVFLSFRKQGEDIYTYWGIMTPLGEEHAVSGRVYFEKEAEGESIQTENVGDTDELEDWIGEYVFSESFAESFENMFYDVIVYEENEQYYADLIITGSNTEINVKTQLYGDDQWVSLVLVGYNPEHKSGLEDMENEVLLSLRKQGENIYTYWGLSEMTRLLLNNYTTYYHSNQYFSKVEE